MATISALSSLVESVGANRIVPGVKIPHPVGEDQAGEGDARTRRRVLAAAIRALATGVTGPTIFSPADAPAGKPESVSG